MATLYYWYYDKPSEDIQKITINQSLIVPGSNKAMLTLGNGSRIVLDNVQIGTLAKEGNTHIIKSDDGKLVYNDSISEIGDENPPSPLKKGKLVRPQFNTLTTPRGGQHQIILSDGTRVWLNAASSIRFPSSFYSTIGITSHFSNFDKF